MAAVKLPAAPKAAKPEKPEKPHPMEGAVLAGDHVYVRHPKAGPMAVKVLAAGRHGVTAECDKGGRYRVPYDHVLGHRARMLQDWRLVDQGADGAILEGADGARRYLEGEVPTTQQPAGPKPAKEDDPLTGGLAQLGKPKDQAMTKALLLFFKGGEIANRPGLTLKDTTDKMGHRTKRWTKTTPDQPKGRAAGQAAAGGEGGQPPAAPFKHGDTARFRHGDVEGSGKIIASGEHGVTVQAEDGREHQVKHEHLVRPEGAAKPQFPKRAEGADDKAHAKRIASEMGDPGHLPEEHDKYFNTDKATHTVPMDKLRSSKSPEENAKGGTNAAKLMHAAYHGELGKRDPIEVHPTDDGGYQVKDGNGTLTAAQKHGWKNMPVRVVQPGEQAGEAKPGDQAKPAGGDVKPLFTPAEEEHLPDDAAQPAKTWEDLNHLGSEALDQLRTWLNKGKGVSSQLGHTTMTKSPDDVTDEEWQKPGGMLFIAPLKGEARAKEKVEADYGGDWSKLLDVVRCSIAVDTLDDLHKTLDALKQNGLKLAKKPKDRFVKPVPVGYRDSLMNVELPNGMIGEVQLHVKGMLRAKNEGHHHYDTERSLEAKVRKAASAGEDTKLTEEHFRTHLSEEEQSAHQAAKAEQRKIYGQAWDSIVGAGGSDLAKALRPAGAAPKGGGQAGAYSYFHKDGAHYRRFNNGFTESVDDVLHGGAWKPYKGSDPLMPALWGEEVSDPLAGGGKPMRKALILFAKG